MRFELFVALRYLFARRKQAFIYIISAMSVLGVAIGVAALVVVLGVYNGFTTDIRDKILGANAHIIVSGPLAALTAPPSDADFEKMRGGEAPELSGMAAVLRRINATPGVVGSTPFLYAEGMLSSPRGVKGVVLRGIDPKTAPDVLTMLDNLSSGSVADLNASVEGAPPGVLIGKELAQRLGLVVGSRVNLLSPSGQKTTAGFQPRIRPYKVAGIFQTGMFEYDSSLGFISLAAARDLLGLPSDQISGIEVTVKDVYKADTVAAALQKELGPLASVRTWMDMNANLFAAIKPEKICSLITTLVMLVMEKTHDIAILMSMGATKGMIRRIFMLQGTIIGVVGTLLGYVLGIGLALLLQRYQFIKLPPGVYTLDHLPILLNWVDIVVVGVSAMTLCFLATIYPARQASSLEPAEALRFE